MRKGYEKTHFKKILRKTYENVAIGWQLRIRKSGSENQHTKFVRTKNSRNGNLFTSDEDTKILRKFYENS